MKKLALSLLAITGLITASYAFATASSGYYSTLHPNANTSASAKSPLFPPTDITVINSSTSLVHVVVPGTSINDTVAPPTNDPNAPPPNDHIRNGSYYGTTEIVLQDPNFNTFFDQSFCRLAVVTINGCPGQYHVNVDNEYCT